MEKGDEVVCGELTFSIYADNARIMKGVCRRRNENWFARYFRGEAPFLQTYYFGGLVFSILALFAVWLLPDLCAPNSRIVSFMLYFLTHI